MGLLQMPKLARNAAKAACATLWFGATANAAINVSFSTGAPTSIQKDFIASTTGQYLSTITASPYFPNTYSVIIDGKRPGYEPPIISSPILTSTAVDQCMAYGFGQGMDSERFYNKQLIQDLQSKDVLKGTCGFQPVALSTKTVSVSTGSCTSSCWQVYNVIVSTIEERWSYIFNSTGGVVAK